MSVFREDAGGTSGLKFGGDGRLYAAQGKARRIVAWDANGQEKVLAEEVNCNDLCVSARGEVYFTDPPARKVWKIDAAGARQAVVEQGIAFPNGVALSADQSLLLVVDYRDRWVWSYQVLADGSLAHGEPFYRLEMDEACLGDGMTVDTEGFLYVATRLGIQVCDQPGRVNAILNPPQRGALTHVAFGGSAFDWLYVTCGGTLFRRHLRRTGAVAWNPVKPPQPRL